MLAEEVLPGVGTTIELAVLQLAITNLVHNFLQSPTVITLEQRIPLAAPDHLNDLPSRTPEDTLQLLNNFAVAAHRPVEPL